jgi:hypothetical protein
MICCDFCDKLGYQINCNFCGKLGYQINWEGFMQQNQFL